MLMLHRICLGYFAGYVTVPPIVPFIAPGGTFFCPALESARRRCGHCRSGDFLPRTLF
jgi:hypothetical protein